MTLKQRSPSLPSQELFHRREKSHTLPTHQTAKITRLVSLSLESLTPSKSSAATSIG